MIEVIDDLLPKDLVNRIERTLRHEDFYWFALDNLSTGDNEVRRQYNLPSDYDYIETPGMSKPFWRDGIYYDPYGMYMMSRMIIDYVCEHKQWSLNQLLRIKANFLTQCTDKLCNKNSVHYPHIDHYNEHYVIVYYVNDTDGDTVLFNEKWKPEDDGKIIDLTVKERVTPKRGRIVLFDGLHYHTSQNPINYGERYILNMNFTVEK